MFDEFVDNTERYEEFIEELLGLTARADLMMYSTVPMAWALFPLMS